MSRSFLPRRGARNSFTLVELLLVMAIILILASLATYAGVSLFKQGMRKRAAAEIQTMSAALEAYKSDNGTFPISDGLLLTNTYPNYDGTVSNDEYQTNATILYTSLSGQANYATAPVAGTKVYMQFKPSQVGNPAASYSYVKDPWNAAYGYSTGTVSTSTSTNPYNGFGQFDLWSTAGVTKAQAIANASGAPTTNTWITNWSQ